MRPSPALFKRRIAFTTKEVGPGFYRGTRTGSMGAHTRYGGYIIDWRKVRSWVVPDLENFKVLHPPLRKLIPFFRHANYPILQLRPFVESLIDPKFEAKEGNLRSKKDALRVDGMEFLKQWKFQNPEEYEDVRNHQATALAPEAEEVEEMEATGSRADAASQAKSTSAAP